jgi:hypothetical protein
MSDDFYVGYFARAPRRLGRFVRRIVIGVVLTGAVTAAALVVAQQPFASSRFEFGEYSHFAGVLREWPYPSLLTPNGEYLLVGPGKHGLSTSVRGLNGQQVDLRASLIQRSSDLMLEADPASLHAHGSAARPPGEVDLGRITLIGEIVDSKCYFGVMNPGNGKVHRDCAARCIAGGVPPAFIARDAHGSPKTFLLAGSDGRKLNGEVLSFVAEPVELDGELIRSGSTLMLRTEPRNFHRITK